MPSIQRLQDILDIGNTTWAGVEINFHVTPVQGENWAPDFSAACLINDEPALVPEAMEQQRRWDRDPENSFYCYAPVGYLQDGTRMTLLVHPRDAKGQVTKDVVWRGEFLVWLDKGEYRLQQIVSLSTGTQAELEALPGIGPKIAEAIIAYREMHGPFTAVEQLDAVPMMGPDKIEALRGLIRP
jgi:competence ComEA-like helix-hairpin-helix protein